MEDRYTLFLIGGDDDEQAVFTLNDDGSDCRLRCEYRGKVVETVASDYFQALCDARVHLARDGLVPFCYGASLNVYPSGMARDMGQGLKAYKLKIGEQARTTDLVEIFAEGPDVIPACVDLQEEYYRDWLDAFRS